MMARLHYWLMVVLLLTIGLPTAWSKTLQAGDAAPHFMASSHKGSAIGLNAYKGKPLVVVFYPADFTPGCTVQLCSLRDHYTRITALGADVVAINPADVGSHANFAKKHQLPFHVLADKDNVIARAFGVKNSWGFNTRTVFVLNAQGTVVFKDEGMPSVDTLIHAIQTSKPHG